MAEPTYRRATPDIATAIAVVGHIVWEDMGERSGFPQEPTPEGFAELMSRERAAVFVCGSEHGVCGFSVLSTDPADPGAAVMGVWLLPTARRKGIGRELALMALEFARAAGYAKVRGTLPAGNEAALSFFSEIGALAQVVGGGMQYELPL